MARTVRMAMVVGVCAALTLPAGAQQTVGLFVNEDPDPGYTLFSPIGTFNSHLIDNDGLEVNTWTGSARPGQMAYLTPNGTLIRSTKINPGAFPAANGSGGRFEEYDWDGALVWEFEYASNTHFAHHDFELMPNGNLLILAWELITAADAIAEGKDPADVTGDFLLESIVEVQPTPPVGGILVWEWYARDHLIQDFDGLKPNFGVIADHPELIDFNHSTRHDMLHMNGIDYNPALDQIIVSTHGFSELWVLDHSTTTAEAAGHSGGNSGMGGDLIYRWGNPAAYDRGTPADRQLYTQHDTQWIDPGLPGAGNMLIFNNNPPPGDHSTIVEIVPPVDMTGNYTLGAGQPYGPAFPIWIYQANPPEDFYGSNTSGAVRLPNGNTLATLGPMGRMRELEPDGTVTWEYQNPDTGLGLLTQGDPVTNSGVPKARRYPPDYPGLAGKDLTPGDPVELFTRPAPADSLLVDKLAAGANRMALSWSGMGCPSFDYHVLYGDLANVTSATVDAALCNIGTSGSFTWQSTPPADLFYVIVGTDDTGIYESGWGATTAGPRGGTKASFECGTTTKVLDAQCP